MAGVVHLVATASTAGGTSYTSGAFTPASNDLLVAYVIASGTVATPTMTDSQSLGFTLIASAVKQSGVDTLYVFVANALAAASSMTVTFDCTGDVATGAVIAVAGVSGMSRVGSNAVLQSAKQDNKAGGAPAPAVTFGAAVQTGNPTLIALSNSANPAVMTPPTGWTELAATGYASPTTGFVYDNRDSGFTGTTITWGSNSSSASCSLAVELDTSAAGGSYSITGSGGLVFNGSTSPLRGRALSTAGGLAFAGIGAIAAGRVIAAAGGVTFAGSTTPLQGRAVTPAGGLVFGGTVTPIRGAAVAGTGGLVFSGLAGLTRGQIVAGAGGLVWGGTAPLAFGRVIPAAGGLVFSGAATIVSGGSGSFSITGSGGIVFTGLAGLLRGSQLAGTGGLQWGGAAGIARGRLQPVAGTLAFGGAGPVAFGRSVTASGGVTFSGTATPLLGRALTGSGGLLWGGTSLVLRGTVVPGSGGLQWSGAATVVSALAQLRPATPDVIVIVRAAVDTIVVQAFVDTVIVPPRISEIDIP